MVAGQHKLSRRAVLAGACGVVAEAGHTLPRHPGPFGSAQDRLDPGPTFFAGDEKVRWMPDQVRHDEVRARVWQKAFQRLTRAQAEIDALAHTKDEDAYDLAVGRQNAALARVLKAAAPDLTAVGVKIGLIAAEQAWELSFGDAAFAVLAEDVRRLGGDGPA